MGPTSLELVRLASGYLQQRGVPSPRLEAEVLLAHALGVARIELYLQYEKPLADPEVDRFREFTRRRARREPSAYITGCREFWSLDLRVDRNVLVPRADTEVLVETALARVGEGPRRVLDVGTGSGAIALALLAERREWSAVGVDSSAEALAVATANAARLGHAERFEGRRGDLFSPVEGELFDAIVSNPPYIASGEIDGLEPEVSRYEPREALDGGPDGLDTIRRLCAEAPRHLAAGGWLLLEFGAGQEGRVETLVREFGGYQDISVLPDYTGRPRVAAARRTSSN